MSCNTIDRLDEKFMLARRKMVEDAMAGRPVSQMLVDEEIRWRAEIMEHKIQHPGCTSI